MMNLTKAKIFLHIAILRPSMSPYLFILHYLLKTGLENKFILLHISFHLKSVIPKAESKSFFPERNIFCQSRYCQKLKATSTSRDKISTRSVATFLSS